MTLPLPRNRPQLTRQEKHARIVQCKIDRARYPMLIVGIRGYYRDSIGGDGINDRGLYDDALFIGTPDAFVSNNGSTDPSRYKKGAGAGKGIAALGLGVYFAHQFALHRGKYVALCLKAGPVTVMRDGSRVHGDRLLRHQYPSGRGAVPRALAANHPSVPIGQVHRTGRRPCLAQRRDRTLAARCRPVHTLGCLSGGVHDRRCR